jgi:hypothetical protein
MIMIDTEMSLPAAGLLPAAEGTPTVLSREHPVVIGMPHTVLAYLIVVFVFKLVGRTTFCTDRSTCRREHLHPTLAEPHAIRSTGPSVSLIMPFAHAMR